MKEYFVYILASKKNGTLYIGVTNNLIRRINEHKNNLIEGFTSKSVLIGWFILRDFQQFKKQLAKRKDWKNGNDNGKLN